MIFKRKSLIFAIFIILNTSFVFSQSNLFPPYGIELLKKSYPDVKFDYFFVQELNDWKIDITVFYKSKNNLLQKKSTLFWCNGKMLPEEELAEKEKYWPIIYSINKLQDPALMTEQQKEKLREFSSSSNRKSGAGTPMFFFDAIYDTETRGSTERHIKQIKFLTRYVNVHERMIEPLNRINQKIQTEAKKDKEVKLFIEEIKSAGAYSWRIIDGTSRKSFHSLGIAVDILPKHLYGKEIFWSWAKDKNPKGWMLTPLSRRWIPPLKVIKIFEEEGFIWGGNWAIWDNMHFEYHPELVAFNAEKCIPENLNFPRFF